MTARRENWLFALFAFVILAAGIGLRDPWPADEPRFALSAQQMVESGDWLIPHRGHEIYADKPPAFMVAQAASYEVTRNWRIAFLLPSLLAALGTLWLVYDLARRLWDRRTGLYAAGALLTAFQFVYQAKRAQIDPAVTFFITLANYGLLRHFLLGNLGPSVTSEDRSRDAGAQEPEHTVEHVRIPSTAGARDVERSSLGRGSLGPDWRMYWLGCFAAGLGVITKGVGVLALFLFAPYIFARFARWNFVAPTSRSTLRWLGGAFAFLAALALWFVPLAFAVQADPKPEYAAYLHDILFRQTAARYTDSWDHQHPFWYYAGVIATGWLPLVLALPWLLPRWRDALRARDARFLLPLVWIALIVLFFSFPRGKRDIYILPALPMFALAAAPYLQDILQRPWARRAALALAAVIGSGFLGAGMYFLLVHPPFARDLAEQRGLANAGAALWWLLIALGVVSLACVAYFRATRAVRGLIAVIAGLWLLWSFWAYPLLNDSSSSAGLMRHAGELIGRDAELGLVAWKEQNLLFADRKVAEFGFVKPVHEQLGEAILWQRSAPERRWVFVLADAMAPCIDRAQARYVGHANRREWWLFRADAVAPACRDGKVPSRADINRDPNED